MKDTANLDIHFNDDTSTKASNLYKPCYNFDFVVTLVTIRSILSYNSASISINRRCESSIS